MSSPRVSDVADLNCEGSIEEAALPPAGAQALGDAVALESSESSRSAHQTSLTNYDDPALRLFSKTILAIRSDAVSELVVPERWLGHIAFQWNSPQPTTDLRIGPCPGDSRWLSFPGGYLVSEVGCFDFIVRTSVGDETATVGIGAPCPGQTAPDGPTES